MLDLAAHPRNIDDRIAEHHTTAPAPPVPALSGRLSLRYAQPHGDDLAMIHGWMNAPHVARFWQQDWPVERWRAHLEQMYAHTFERPYILSHDGAPIGYVELYRAARDVVAEHYAASPRDIGVHGAIGDTDYVGKNIALLFWLDAIPAIFRADAGCATIVTDPAADHPVAVRLDQAVADRVGGERIGDVALPHKRATLFRYTRAGLARAGLPA